MQAQLPSRCSGGNDELDGNWQDVDDSFKSFIRLNKKVKTEKLLRNFAAQVQTQCSSIESRVALCNSLKEIKAQFAGEGTDVLRKTTTFLESSDHLNELERNIILQEILLVAQMVALKTVQNSVKCSTTLVISRFRKLYTFLKEIRKERIETKEAKAKFDCVKSILKEGKKHCSLAKEYMEKFDSATEIQKEQILNLICKERELILKSYNDALKEMDNLQIDIESSHFKLKMVTIEQNGFQLLNLKIIEGSALNLLEGNCISLANFVALKVAVLAGFLIARKTKGIKHMVTQLEQELNVLTGLINEIKMIEEKAQKFIDARSTLENDNWFQSTN